MILVFLCVLFKLSFTLLLGGAITLLLAGTVTGLGCILEGSGYFLQNELFDICRKNLSRSFLLSFRIQILARGSTVNIFRRLVPAECCVESILSSLLVYGLRIRPLLGSFALCLDVEVLFA